MIDAAIAMNRFGLGVRPDDPLPNAPKSWLIEQFAAFQSRPQALANLPSLHAAVGDLSDYFMEFRTRRAERLMDPASSMVGPAGGMTGGARPQVRLRRAIQDDYVAMNAARFDSALNTRAPFAERLVHFWSNHFAVSVDKLQMVPVAGLLEFEAIRPHVFGRFSDLLLAVERHPAMLVFLDQAQSVGPNSQLGRGRRKHLGINENLAREIMELHTVGARTGYTQADVTEFAKALTGWTVRGLGNGPGQQFLQGVNKGDSHFAEELHEPGPRTIMGKAYPQQGEEQSRAILLDLAANPSTARHLSTKLARHFAGDAPPQTMVDRLASAYLSSGGDLSMVYRALVASPEAWQPQPLKFKTPWEWSVSAFRAVGATQVDPSLAHAMLKQLGEPTWKSGSPAGWDDVAASWAAPEALMLRVEAAQAIADRAGSSLDARSLAGKVLPGSLGEATRAAIARAASPQEGLALLLVSPEFMRR